jgi:hypothetical protein
LNPGGIEGEKRKIGKEQQKEESGKEGRNNYVNTEAC